MRGVEFVSGAMRGELSVQLCVLQGIAQNRRLPEPTTVDPHTMEESERKQRGIRLLSGALRQALDAFTADKGRLLSPVLHGMCLSGSSCCLLQ